MPIYVVALDANDLRVDPRAIRDVLKPHPEVEGWWNHLPGVFLVSTSLTAPALRKLLLPVTGNISFLLAPVDLAGSDGWLPESAWAWIKRREASADRVDA